MTAEQLPGFLSEFAIFHDGGYKNNEGINLFSKEPKKWVWVIFLPIIGKPFFENFTY